MTTGFADTSFYIALVNPRDEFHEQALRLAQEFRGRIVTTEYILVELGNWLSKSGDRVSYTHTVEQVRADPETTICPATSNLFDRGFELFADRADKDWSMTDCISFVVMHERTLVEVLSADHHFEQAGFTILLK